MKAFSEKGDLVLRTLNTAANLSWEEFTQLTNITPSDAILIFLKNRELIGYSDKELKLTNKGKQFITTTSFVEQRDNKEQA